MKKKARLKTSRENIKSCGSMASTWRDGEIWSAEGLAGTDITALPIVAYMPSLLSLFSPLTLAFFRCSVFLGSLTSGVLIALLAFHSHSFTLSPFRGKQHGLLKSGWKSPWLHNSYILYVHKSSIIRMMPVSAASLGSKQTPLDHGFRGL